MTNAAQMEPQVDTEGDSKQKPSLSPRDELLCATDDHTKDGSKAECPRATCILNCFLGEGLPDKCLLQNAP